MSEPPESLSNAEWKCLESISRVAAGDTPADRAGVSGGRDCSEGTLHQLAAKGLIELVAAIWMPLEMKRSVYRLTAAGISRIAAGTEQNDRGT